MKKLIISLVVGSFLLSIQPVQAKKFTEKNIFAGYFYNFVEKEITSHFYSRKMVQFLDEENRGYFNISPTAAYYYNKDYQEEAIDLNGEQLEEISKILYYGYGYKNQNTNEYYAATQYLIFKTFEAYNCDIRNSLDTPVLMFEQEIKQIKANMENKKFTFENLTVKEKTFEIKDVYIKNHFNVQGEHIKVETLEDKIKITLDGKVKDYQIDFVPKETCENVTMWQSNTYHLFRLDEVCETTYSRTIHYEEPLPEKEPTIESKEPEKTEEKNKVPNQEEEKPETTEDKKVENTSKKESDEKTQEEVLVEVPSTGKQSMMLFLVFGLLGNCYYAFKK